MYKTVRHGENSLQYTILPQQDEGSTVGARQGTRRHRKKGKTAAVLAITIVLIGGVIGTAVLVPLLLTSDLVALPAAFQKIRVIGHTLIILLGNMHKLSESEIWLASSATKKSNNHTVDCINCTDLALKLGIQLCQSLPAFHAFTGCDYTAAFYNKGKVKPLQLFSKNEKYQTVFASLTDPADIFLDEKMKVVQEFTASMYGIKNCTSVNDARHRIFMKNYSAKEDGEHFKKKIKGFDSNSIPPCWVSLLQKILRTIFVNSMWLHATDPICMKLQPENCGWFLDEFLKPVGFIGDHTQNNQCMSDDSDPNPDYSGSGIM